MGVKGWTLEIPLSGAQGNQGGGSRIGYVDMERIFQIYPQTKDAKDDYFKKREKMREDLTAKERKVEEVKQKLAILEATLLGLRKSGVEGNTASTSTTTQTPPETNPDSITQAKRDLESLQAEVESDRQTAENDLASFEKKQTQIILGKIFGALQELAEEEQVTLVVDKSSILYGAVDIDLTEKLQRRVRGY
jgi:Skp family chaperone for outer membrane proteins